MSYDLKLFRRCDHFLHFQQVTIDPTDFRSLRLNALMGSSQNARLFVNGTEQSSTSGRYSWKIIKDENSYEGQQRKFLFLRRQRSSDDFFEVSYYAHPQLCPKCSGLGALWDYEYSNIGQLLKVQNEDKLSQDQEKIILTVLGSSIFHPWYGTSIVDLIGKKIPPAGLSAQFNAEISQALDNLRKLQRQQERYQLVTDKEFLQSIILIEVLPTVDPTLYTVKAITRTAAGGTATFSRPFKLDSGILTNSLEELTRRMTI